MPPKPGYKQAPEHVARRMVARLATLKAKDKPVSREWLEQEYVTNGRTCKDIAKELGRDPTTILAWIRHYGIPSRPRGHNTDHLPKGRPPGFTISPEHRERLRQARKASPNLPHLNGGAHWLAGRPKSEHPNWKGGITPDRQAFYASPEWREVCRAVWKRADARCERCGADHREPSRRGTFHVHHIVSFAVRELRAEATNLVLLCADCHRFVHSRKNTAREFLEGSYAGS